jgi:hypothetical protein
LNDQVAFMRQVRPGAIPIIKLESRPMPTSYGGTKPRPYFNIPGWRTRDSIVAPQRLLAVPDQQEAEESFAETTSEEILDDDVPF